MEGSTLWLCGPDRTRTPSSTSPLSLGSSRPSRKPRERLPSVPSGFGGDRGFLSRCCFRYCPWLVLPQRVTGPGSGWLGCQQWPRMDDRPKLALVVLGGSSPRGSYGEEKGERNGTEEEDNKDEQYCALLELLFPPSSAPKDCRSIRGDIARPLRRRPSRALHVRASIGKQDYEVQRRRLLVSQYASVSSGGSRRDAPPC